MISDVKQDFPERVEAALARVKNLAALARETGISTNALFKWRKGLSDPSRENLIALASATGVSLLWLAAGQGPMLAGQTDAARSRQDAPPRKTRLKSPVLTCPPAPDTHCQRNGKTSRTP